MKKITDSIVKTIGVVVVLYAAAAAVCVTVHTLWEETVIAAFGGNTWWKNHCSEIAILRESGFNRKSDVVKMTKSDFDELVASKSDPTE